MAFYDSADLLQRCQDAAQLPADDEAMDPAAWYRLLSAAQAQWYLTMAAIVPDALYGAPSLLAVSAGESNVYTFGVDVDGRPVVPIGQVRLFRTEDAAHRPDWPAHALTPGVDFRPEGDRVRVPQTGAVSFADGGPWAVFITPPSAISAASQPSLLPIEARELLVLTAVETWAIQGGLHDPTPWVGRAAKRWNGGGTPGDVGILGALREQYYHHHAPAAGRGGARVSRLSRWGGWA